MDQGLSKRERICSQKAVEALVSTGRYVSCGPLKCRYAQRTVDADALRQQGVSDEVCRILVSVPKRFFKRAVKRNLLKRRIREAYRLQKHLLDAGKDIDIMFVYSSKEVASFDEIASSVQQILCNIKEKV